MYVVDPRKFIIESPTNELEVFANEIAAAAVAAVNSGDPGAVRRYSSGAGSHGLTFNTTGLNARTVDQVPSSFSPDDVLKGGDGDGDDGSDGGDHRYDHSTTRARDVGLPSRITDTQDGYEAENKNVDRHDAEDKPAIVHASIDPRAEAVEHSSKPQFEQKNGHEPETKTVPPNDADNTNSPSTTPIMDKLPANQFQVEQSAFGTKFSSDYIAKNIDKDTPTPQLAPLHVPTSTTTSAKSAFVPFPHTEAKDHNSNPELGRQETLTISTKPPLTISTKPSTPPVSDWTQSGEHLEIQRSMSAPVLMPSGKSVGG